MTSPFDFGRSECLSPEGMRAPKSKERIGECTHATRMRGDDERAKRSECRRAGYVGARAHARARRE